MAEGDRDAYRRQQAAIAREKEIMKDVKGWEVSSTLLLLGANPCLLASAGGQEYLQQSQVCLASFRCAVVDSPSIPIILPSYEQ